MLKYLPFSFFVLLIEETSTAAQLVEYVLDWMNIRHEDSKFVQAKEFLHSKMFGWIKLGAISLSFLIVLISIIACTVNWFNIKITKEEPIHCETGISASTLRTAQYRDLKQPQRRRKRKHYLKTRIHINIIPTSSTYTV